MPDNYEDVFWSEIWDVVNILKIPYDTVMSMPVKHRKVLIRKHNKEDEERAARSQNRVGGSMINAYAAMSQSGFGGGG